jgi:pseudaminic acid synthase|tara:strand:+ start:1362 stop:2408 length:1047 start_codon:yes stop_codon:yes gene_type:complete
MFRVANKSIGKGYKPFVIAELSANHGGSIQRAKATILAARNSGADAVKIQTYTPDTMTLDSDKNDFMINDGLWKGYNLYQLYKEAYTPFEWHKELFEFAKSQGVLLFSTPFDETAVELLQELDAPAFKIASFEITDLPLIEYASSKCKPMFISTGMSDLNEIGEALECCYKNGNRDVLLFHCISNYPADIRSSHLGDISYLADYFKVEVGLSDHTTSNLASVLAIANGASAIEKHFKLDEKDCGPDASFSILPAQLKSLCDDCESSFEAMKSNELQRESHELVNKKFRRSIYFVKALAKGEMITKDDIKRVRPGFGLEPKYFDWVVGQKVSVDVNFGDAVTLDVLTKE